jgi:hypothetical protein
MHVTTDRQERDRRAMKRAKLRLLEVLGLLVRMPGEGDVTALPCFAGEERSSGFWRCWG